MPLKVTRLKAFTLNDVVITRDTLRSKLISNTIQKNEQEDLQVLEGICGRGDLITANELSKHGLIIKGLLQEPLTKTEQKEFQTIYRKCRDEIYPYPRTWDSIHHAQGTWRKRYSQSLVQGIRKQTFAKAGN